MAQTIETEANMHGLVYISGIDSTNLTTGHTSRLQKT